MKDGHAVEGAMRQSELDRQYRKIGISAVAAALRYQGEARNPAYARTEADARVLIEIAEAA